MKVIKRSVVFTTVWIFGIFFSNAYADSSCALPASNQRGFCVRKNDCPAVRDIEQNARRPFTVQLTAYLQKIRCRLPNNQPGVCCLSPRQQNNLHLLPTHSCGPMKMTRIAGGTLTEFYEFPWMALLRFRSSEGVSDYSCGASLINNRYVLTAGHCASDSTLYSVILGEYDLRTNIDCLAGFKKICLPRKLESGIEKVIFHPNFNNPTYSNDIALLRLTRNVVFQPHIQPVCLPVTKALQETDFRRVVVTGWGLSEHQTKSNVLLKAKLNVIPLSECENQFRSLNLTDNQFCGKGTGITDTCRGDSGGPLVWPANLDGTKYVQFGIVSLGTSGCGVGRAKPAVYVKLQKYMPWILENIRE